MCAYIHFFVNVSFTIKNWASFHSYSLYFGALFHAPKIRWYNKSPVESDGGSPLVTSRGLLPVASSGFVLTEYCRFTNFFSQERRKKVKFALAEMEWHLSESLKPPNINFLE